jgi:hypothetical protein
MLKAKVNSERKLSKGLEEARKEAVKEDFKRSTIYLPANLRKKIKLKTVEDDSVTMTSIIIEALERYLD